LLDHIKKAGTASEILRDALGVPVTIPIWAEEALREITSNYTIDQLTDQGLDDLRGRLEGIGLEEFYPEALRQVTTRK
jgi:hypothetical protein